MLKLGARCMSYSLPEPVQTYKPVQQITFDVKYETLVYSAENLSKFKVFFPIPWSLGTWSVPVAVWQMLTGSLPVSLLTFSALYLAVLPHCYYLYNLRYTIDKIWYIRGGHWKLEVSGIDGFTTEVLSSPEVLEVLGVPNLDKDGSLAHDVEINAQSWTDFYTTYDNRKLKLPAYGKIVNPELFLAMMQKVKIDDSDFVIDQNRYLA